MTATLGHKIKKDLPMSHTALKISKTISIQKRSGSLVAFDAKRIVRAILGAFQDVNKLDKSLPPPLEVQDTVYKLTEQVLQDIENTPSSTISVEDVQDLVEKVLMSEGHHAIARSYILYREAHKRQRVLDGSSSHLQKSLYQACEGLEDLCNANQVLEDALLSLYEGASEEEMHKALLLSARARIEKEPAYAKVTARLLLQQIYQDVLGTTPASSSLSQRHQNHFATSLSRGVKSERYTPELLDFDLDTLSQALVPERDELIGYLGLQTLRDRYLMKWNDELYETPQFFWMRVAMGLSLNEEEKEKRAIEFYNLLSTLKFISSTPTLFHSGTLHPQLSSCYLSTIEDDLSHIFKVLQDNALLSKWAGGLGNDWTNIRATGAPIHGTGGKSQGVIPFLKVANDTALAVNQGGKRKGAVCGYLETWHLDIEDFLELRKNTGDDRRRTHDMNTANWIPDLFMKRVRDKKTWTLFSPDDVSDLHDLYGQDFEIRYQEYEAAAVAGDIRCKQVEALQLWRRMLTMLFETGHPWITFKDPSNIRSPQDHVGVVHSSNLCTEILLNTSAEETAVCNLGSINLPAHMKGKELDEKALAASIQIAMRMLDNVVDLNFYPTPETKASNLKHRPVGMGMMGFQDCLYLKGISYASEAAVDFADRSMELLSYYAFLSSAKLAEERGAYSSFAGSKWDRGLLPIDTIDLLEQERGEVISMDRKSHLDWTPVRQAIAQFGLRNSNCLAIAPTATIANIAGVSPSIEPTFTNLYVKSNLSGEFTNINAYLVEDLKKLGLWTDEMVDNLKYYDGSVQDIEGIPQELKEKYRTAFEVEPHWLVACASRRQKWIDMGQSLNLYLSAPSGKKLSDLYQLAWEMGLKTTYYLRTLAATQVEKSSLDINKKGLQPRWMKHRSASSQVQVQRSCRIDDPECEACQ